MRTTILGLTAATLVALVILSTASVCSGADPFRMVILSDRTGGHQHGVYPSIIEEINLLAPDIVVTVGDQIEGYTDDMDAAAAEWDSVNAFLAELEAPYYLTAGNHDIWSDDSEALYREKTGREPYYSFDYEGVHFIILDTSRFDLFEDMPEEQFEWLRADLETNADASQTFVFSHKPSWLWSLGEGQPDPVHELLVEHQVDAVFTGHYHHYFSGEYDGLRYASIGSSGGHMYRMETEPVERGEFFQFAWVTVLENDHRVAVVDAGSVYPWDFHTVDDEKEIQRIESSHVRSTPIRIGEHDLNWHDLTVTVENASTVPIDDEIVWDVPDAWDVTPPVSALYVEPGTSEDVTFRLRNRGQLYPAPSFSLLYPMSNGRELTTYVDARIMRTAPVTRLPEPPTIDGDLTDDSWVGAAPVTKLYPAWEGYEVEGTTAFVFGYDDENLYVSAICVDPAVEEIRTEATGRDDVAVVSDDCVGFFFQPDPSELVVYQVYVNAAGVVFDQHITYDEAMTPMDEADWNGSYEIATATGSGIWFMEMRIPLDELDARAGPDSPWRLNFRRKQARTGAASDWQVPIDYNPVTFGELDFE